MKKIIKNNKLFTRKDLQAFGEFVQAHERTRMLDFMNEMQNIGGLVASLDEWFSFKKH
jgi:hypothetical protein